MKTHACVVFIMKTYIQYYDAAQEYNVFYPRTYCIQIILPRYTYYIYSMVYKSPSSVRHDAVWSFSDCVSRKLLAAMAN